MDAEDFKSEIQKVEANLQSKIEKVNNNVELIVMAIKGNPMNPSDQGILGTIKRLEANQHDINIQLETNKVEINKRLDLFEQFKNKITQTYVVVAAIAAFLGTAIGLALALYSTFAKK